MSEYLRLNRMAETDELEQAGYPEVRIAVLGDSSTQPLCRVLKSVLHERNFTGRVFESDFDSIGLEVYDKASRLHAFAPEFVLLFLCSQSVRERFYSTPPEGKSNFASEYLADLRNMVEVLSERGYQVVISTLALPREGLFGNYSAAVPISPLAVVTDINQGIVQLAQSSSAVRLLDVSYSAARVGLDNWHEEKLWAQAKYMCALRWVPMIAGQLCSLIAACKGRVAKCIVLDLDNTLWGGVIGDDGLEGIELEKGAIGEAYTRFQSYLRELKQRGFVLAVCSKNNEDVAKLPFEEHRGMRLTLDDIAVFVANWNDKGSNIAYIAETLDLGLDSMVFIDDSPFEREQVRTMLPQVAVPELPDDPADFASFLEMSSLFESTNFTSEDTKRARMYKEQAQRSQSRLAFGNIDEYLGSLQMKLRIGSFTRGHLKRIEQLLQRSNQFNLCTRRFTQADCEQFMNQPERYHLVHISLEDKFGDYGLIGVVISEIRDSALIILEFVMSCRVLNRGVEQESLNHLVRWSRARGLASITGDYRATAKNRLVEDLYGRLGFQKVGASGDTSSWKLELADTKAHSTQISVEDSDAG